MSEHDRKRDPLHDAARRIAYCGMATALKEVGKARGETCRIALELEDNFQARSGVICALRTRLHKLAAGEEAAAK